MGGVTSRILVPFRGEGAGVGELTWGQQSVWQNMQRTGATMNIGGTTPLPAGTSVEELAATLRFIVGRHQALRTRLRFVPGGPPQQVVSGSGEVALEIVDLDPADAGPGADSAAARLFSRYEITPFDYAAEWPVRMGVVRCGGVPTHVVVVYCHLAVDGFGIDALVRDMAHLDRATGQATAPVAGLTPLELAARQRTQAALRQSDKSLRYWENLLRTIPAQRLGSSADPREPRFWNLTFRSPAMRLAMPAIAHRTRCGVGYVLLAAYAVALARCTGRNPSVAQVLVNNRFRPGCADSASQLAQLSICVVDVADATFDEAVGRAWKAATSAYLHGYFDTLALYDLLDRIDRERGEIDISCIVNDRRDQRGPQPLGAPPTPGELRAALPLTTSWWARKVDTFDSTLNVTVDSAPDAVELSICADTRRLGPAEIQALAAQMEAATVEAAFDGTVPTGVAATDPVRALAAG
jgi:hypothetical protein